jgi:hypothetical protein
VHVFIDRNELHTFSRVANLLFEIFCIVLLSLYCKKPVKKPKPVTSTSFVYYLCVAMYEYHDVMLQNVYVRYLETYLQKRAVCPFKYLQDIKLGVQVFIAPVLNSRHRSM